jgi:ATP/maltotriose-dependent transcriptional regulator MalT
MLPAEHLTSAKIAERLVLSTRTVENHLQRSYAKRGVVSRASSIRTNPHPSLAVDEEAVNPRKSPPD